ncbi:proline racemase family protein [Natrarchaeobaculum sulfurireducens]|uniref:Proline racemase n=1 Tax=Natrarchaeobaculum sulfurireducens TaxID=2044521 RepID=A0A346P9Y7_9EURY|nr:proline racemase family protein [Natrarchaeobaculum sulfurireducens]AXR76332.1 proline racemase [Natrarchaeobaculum sulfurireducens]
MIQIETFVDTLDTHTAGEPTRIVTGGFDRSQIRGGSVADQRDRFAESQDWLRELLMCEPRGHDDMFGAVPVDPASAEADLGLFFMDSRGYLDMCGHGTIGAVTALLETGQLEEKPTIIVETPAGLVRARPSIIDGRVAEVAIRNVDSFVYDTLTLTFTSGHETHTISLDVVFAGNVFALVNVNEVGMSVDPGHVDTFVEYGLEIRQKANDALNIRHPQTGRPHHISIVEFYEHRDGPDRNVVVFGEGQIDRSPCGTGTCAKMTLLHDANELAVDEPYRYESVIGTGFTGRILESTSSEGITVTTPEVSGTAHITGRHTFLCDERDDLLGFSLRD